MLAFRLVAAIGLALVTGACATTGYSSFKELDELDPDVVPTFANAAEVDAYLAAQERERAAIRARKEAEGYDDSNYIVVTGSHALEDIAITNTQVAGVDEGGIVKATTDYLVILRRGRVHVVRHGEDSLEKVSSIDAFPPGDKNPGDTWYDEMLLHEGMVVVIGYSYGEGGTEISRFNLSNEGQLTYRDTHYLSSSDYYSSRNYASRLVDGTFFTYTPTSFNAGWRETLPFLEKRLPDGSRERVGTTLKPTGMGLAAPLMVDPSPSASMMHGITSCDVLSEVLTCQTRTVLGRRSAEYYFTAEAAYIWTDIGYNPRWGRAKTDWGNMLYRIPFDTSEAITAMSVQGAPVDQFSFHVDYETGSLFVVTVGDFVFEDTGEFWMTMWESEFSFGEGALAQIPIEEMGNGATRLPIWAYRPLPEFEGSIQNRFVGRHLMIGSSRWFRGIGEVPDFYITPLDARWIQRIDLPHSVTRLDRLGNDGVAIGPDNDDALGFSAIEFEPRGMGGKLGSTFMLPAAEEGENRSQAFYWRADPGDPESGDGLMALPVDREIEGYDFYFLGSATEMFFLERKGGELAPVGALGTLPDEDVIKAAEEMQNLEEEGDCQASCVDWYGNSRPIFIGDRIFALMGDEVLEGRIEEGTMREIRRVNFAR